MLVISCYSRNTPYEKEARLLARSLELARMPYRIEPFDDAGSWFRNTAMKARVIAALRAELEGPLLFVDADAFVHRNCSAYFEELAVEGYDLGAHYFRAPRVKAGAIPTEGWRFLSGTLLLGDTEATRRLCQAWVALNDTLAAQGVEEGAGQKNLWFLTTCLPELRIARLPGAYCYVADRAICYEPGTRPTIEHTNASREHRIPGLHAELTLSQRSRRKRRQELTEKTAIKERLRRVRAR
jgi:hypothetical protein